jgi:hypothetical protein
MNITLKNFKHAAFASQETYCFEATVYIDGKKAGHASNEGHGGCTFVHLDEAFRHLDTPENDLDGKVDDLVHKLVCEKQDKAILASVKRDLSKNLLFRRNDTKAGEMRIIKGIVGNKPAYEAKVASLKADPTVVVIYNTLPLEDAAKAMYPHYKTIG